MVGKVKPGVFIFDLVQNKLQRVHFGKHLDELKNYMTDPTFDEKSKGLIISSIHMPVKKLGTNYCLNHPTSLIYVKDPKFSKDDAEKVEEGQYYLNLTKNEFMSLKPTFSRDCSKLVYIASPEKFISHSNQYQLRCFDWPLQD